MPTPLRSLPLALALTLTAGASAQDFSGQPALLNRGLGEWSYVPLAAKRLANAKLIWTNPDFAGPKVNETLMREAAFGIPSPNESPADFLGEEKIFYADRYGGSDFSGNAGSGRAASVGDIQVKGIGQTELVKNPQADQSNGFMTLNEAMREAIWSEINARTLPYGSNRVIAIIDRGTSTVDPYGKTQRNVLVVREDPSRPAHYMATPHAATEWLLSEGKRVKEAASYLVNALPVPAELKDAPVAAKLQAGLDAYTDRLADQYAAAFAAKLFQGVTAPANVELSGRFLDYGTQTAQPGYGKIQVRPMGDGFGETKAIKKILIQDFVDNLRKKTILAESLPRTEELTGRFDAAYEKALDREFLRLSGLPDSLVKRLGETPEGKTLGRVLRSVATEGARAFTVNHEVPDQLTQFDFERVMRILSHSPSLEPDDLMRELLPEFKQHVGSVSALAHAYAKLMKRATELAAADGVKENHLRELMAKRSDLLNKKTPDLYRGNMVDQDDALIANYLRTQDPAQIATHIDQVVENSTTRFPDDEGAYRVTLAEKRDPRSQTRARKVYDARSGQTESVHRTIPRLAVRAPLPEVEHAKAPLSPSDRNAICSSRLQQLLNAVGP